MRSSVTSLFTNRDCFALVRPLTDEAQLAAMDKMAVSQLRPEFRQVGVGVSGGGVVCVWGGQGGEGGVRRVRGTREFRG